jgi:hypothetical protein
MDLVLETGRLVNKDFELAQSDFISEEDLEKALSAVIYRMIDHELEKLFSILYRLDINEQKVHAALKKNNDIAPHIAIAKLIIKRHKEKLITRQQYRQEKDDDSFEKW